MELTQELVRELFNYHEDGYLIWKIKPRQNVNIGDIAGHLTIDRGEKRHSTMIYGKGYRISRLIFFYHTGKWPQTIDHINRVTTDNRIQNLRAATRAENSRNRNPSKNSSSKYLGVGWHKATQKWCAKIKAEGKDKHLGVFTSEITAALIYNKSAVKYFGEFANLNIIIPSNAQNNF
jgi:hypothetical protein